MTLLDKLERRFGFLGIPGLIRIVIGFTALVWVLMLLNPEFVAVIDLDPARIGHAKSGDWSPTFSFPVVSGRPAQCKHCGWCWPSGFSGSLAKVSNARGGRSD